MKIGGVCDCSDIAFEAELDPAKANICCCIDCQNISATVFPNIAVVDGATLTLLSGEPREYINIDDSGNRPSPPFSKSYPIELIAAPVRINPSFIAGG